MTNNTFMMRPDLNIAIAYSGKHQSKVAEYLQQKLKAYAASGYPVSVSLIKEELIELERDKNRSNTGKSVDTLIAEQMAVYFSSFDCAIFLFDTNGIAHPLDGTESDLLSSNLIYEYGLASSAFINKDTTSFGQKNLMNGKHIICFSPKEISGNSLKYIKGLDLKIYDKVFPDDYEYDADKQSDYIIQYYIHKNIIREKFYGMPDELPNLTYRNGVPYSENLGIKNPMALTVDNDYWSDLNQLQADSIRIELDVDSAVLNTAFTNEYNKFEKADTFHNNSEFVLARRILYIVERAVFIVYLRCEEQ
jgi:hypothetical protein